MLNFRSFIAQLPYARQVKRRIDKALNPNGRDVGFPSDRMKSDRKNCVVSTCPEIGISPLTVESFCLYRIIGNDLVPRHKKGQSRDNLAFILEYEPDLIDCEKRFVVNRIVDPEEELQIINLLESTGYPYIHIPFDWEEYRKVGWDIEGIPCDFAPYASTLRELPAPLRAAIIMRTYRYKNNYAMNNNGARNIALQDGRGRAKWVLPWDGNCFLTENSWGEIRRSVISNSKLPYHIVPMARITDNEDLLNPSFRPEAIEEPQVLFRADAKEEFNTEYSYGRRPKVELFWRLGVPGKWDKWPIEPWDLPCPDYSSDAGDFSYAGWVARLFSGKAELEKQRDHKAWVGRGEARTEAITGMLDHLDAKALDVNLEQHKLIFINPNNASRKHNVILEQLKISADQALDRGPYSVAHKTTLPPGGNRHDYWHPAPYYWPNPLKIPGLPYIRRDGQRVPGTRMYEPLSDRYDRTRLQRLFDDTYVLALAWYHFGDEQYGKHGASFVRYWFLDSDTAMTPHLDFAQVRRGYNKNRGAASGIIEFKDLYYFLDAVRVLELGKFLSEKEISAFKTWLGTYLHWLQHSKQGVEERSALNNHGTYYDLQVSAICAFLGEAKLLRETLRDSRFRLLAQFDEHGYQPHEMKRTNTAHYCCFNLQGWFNLCRIAEAAGEDIWNFSGRSGNGIQKGAEWFLSYAEKSWPYKQIDNFDSQRFLPIAFGYEHQYGQFDYKDEFKLPEISSAKPLFHPHDGVRPFWNLEFGATGYYRLKVESAGVA
ncbi:alginate lyase family protein [Microbulbifer echini]|uniref:Alginate lyase family protein n=1 Tax=Microbulbifer echini TaxID=1529067 RepID=A0ABV4NRH2_9GAMM